jgi:hypothetical protein
MGKCERYLGTNWYNFMIVQSGNMQNFLEPNWVQNFEILISVICWETVSYRMEKLKSDQNDKNKACIILFISSWNI